MASQSELGSLHKIALVFVFLITCWHTVWILLIDFSHRNILSMCHSIVTARKQKEPMMGWLGCKKTATVLADVSVAWVRSTSASSVSGTGERFQHLHRAAQS